MEVKNLSSLVNKVPLTERIAEKLISKERFQEDEESYEKVKYGVEVILINTMKIGLVYLVSLLMGVFFETLIVHFSFLIVRRYSFGLHALKSLNCTLISLLVFVAGPFFLRDVSSSNWLVLIIFAIILLNVFLYAPADTESLPLLGATNRKMLRNKAVLCTLLLMGVTLSIPFAEIKTLILFGAFYQMVCIHPLTYKLLKRRRNSYEIYE